MSDRDREQSRSRRAGRQTNGDLGDNLDDSPDGDTDDSPDGDTDDAPDDEPDDELDDDPDDEPEEDAPGLRHDEYIDPEERAKLEDASADLEREVTGAEDLVREEIEIPYEKLDIDALKVVSRLRRFDHEAYLVGGCVRDLLLGLSPKDFDLATSARPDEIRSAFTNCRLIGRRFRLAHIYFRGGKVIETATFRRNPRQEDDLDEDLEEDLYLEADNVYGTAEEDARRRDFTINALFYDPRAGRVLDFVGGRQDLDSRLIRTVGDPAIRMPEDPVRILRAVRFAAKLGFRIEDGTWRAMKEHVGEIQKCPAPRVTEEILRLLRSGASRGAIVLLGEIGALDVLIPPVAEHLESVGNEGEARFYALLDAADEWVHEHGGPPDDAVLLSALLATLFTSDGLPSSRKDAPGLQRKARGVRGPPDPKERLDALLTSLVRDARLPRKVAERVRLVLGAQRVFSGQRKRRFSSKRFLGQSYIPHAMALFDMRVRAYGEDHDQYKYWSRRVAEQGGKRPAGGRNGTGANRRRRRRRRSPRGR